MNVTKLQTNLKKYIMISSFIELEFGGHKNV